MLLEVGLIVAGIPIGYALRKQDTAKKWVNHTLSCVIYTLLFLIGMTLGSNADLLARLTELGVQGILIGILCALGSAVAAWLFYVILMREKKV